MQYVLNAAQYALNRWVTIGVPPATAARLDVTTTDAGPSFVLDANGDVTGGIRTPSVDVPVATLSGLGQSGSQFCWTSLPPRRSETRACPADLRHSEEPPGQVARKAELASGSTRQ